MSYGPHVRSVVLLITLSGIGLSALALGCNNKGGSSDGPAPAASNIPRAAPSATGAKYDLPSGPIPVPKGLPRREGAGGGGTAM